jgi:hypothetical protein
MYGNDSELFSNGLTSRGPGLQGNLVVIAGGITGFPYLTYRSTEGYRRDGSVRESDFRSVHLRGPPLVKLLYSQRPESLGRALCGIHLAYACIRRIYHPLNLKVTDSKGSLRLYNEYLRRGR